jgi:hypothetical protein
MRTYQSALVVFHSEHDGVNQNDKSDEVVKETPGD